MRCAFVRRVTDDQLHPFSVDVSKGGCGNMRSVKAENVSPIAGVPPANEVKYGYVFYLHSARKVGVGELVGKSTHVNHLKLRDV